MPTTPPPASQTVAVTTAEAEPAPAAPRVTAVKSVNAGECPASGLIDDAEDGDGRVLSADKRGGYWYTYTDKVGTTITPTGSFSMAPGGAEGSKFAAHMSGKLAASGIVYAGMGFSFADPRAAYDVSCCKGVRFWAKKSGAGSGGVRVKVGDANTTPDGGVCRDCYNDFGAELKFTDSWQKYELTFADLKQEFGWGNTFSALDVAHLYQLQWQVRDSGADFDISIDKVELTGCAK